jgi:predicted lipid-binding transport protein (Tim44 family)
MRAIRGSAVCVGVLLAIGANAACAAALGSLVTSLGLFAALAALFVIKGWPTHAHASAFSTAGATLLIAGGAAWLWRSRLVERLSGLGGRPIARGWRSPRIAVRSVPVIDLPEGLDRETLLADMRAHFVLLQDAWDRGDAVALNSLATPDMLAELRLELPGCTAGIEGDRTEIVTLAADLLGFERLAQAVVVSVEFSGLIRESAAQGAVPFRELWLLTQSNDAAAGWRLARHQALL